MEYEVIRFLEDHEIPHKTRGKNVTSGWIEIECPYEECSDPSMHCGINLESSLHSCWICGNKGNFPKLVSKLLEISYRQAERFLRDYFSVKGWPNTFEPPITQNKPEIDISSFLSECPPPHLDYLLKREFSPSFLEEKYHIRYAYHKGEFCYRVIIPIIINNKIVNFTSRDVTDKQEPKYKTLSNYESVISAKNCIYNYDRIKDKTIICEGVFDVWRLGDFACATLGTKFTTSQLQLLSKKKIKEAYVLFDAEAEKEAEKLANNLSVFISKVKVLILDEKDPADMEQKEADYLVNQIIKGERK